ncbi:MAG: type IV pilus assembly protein PilM [Halanaerobiaceae bacterium]|nr:type IV pilus assembly protein PilM [Halanaerobiaceae bacterium]
MTVIDIGTDSIKAGRFKKRGKSIFIEGLSIKSLPYQTIREGRIVDEAVVSNRLSEIVNELKCRGDRIITTIPNNNLVIRNMELPEMDDKARLAEAIKWESEDHLPFPDEGSVQDFKILSREDGKVQILLVATKRDMIDNILGVFERISLTPSVINIQPMALISLADYQNNIENIVAIIDIGTSGTRVIIGDRQNIYLSRNIDIGGNDFTKIIMDEEKLNYIDAENVKKKNGIPEVLEEDDIESIAQMAATGMGQGHYMTALARNLAEQIGRSLDYYNMKYRNKIDRIFITGGGSRLEGLKEIIERGIERDLSTLDPFINIGYKKNISLKGEEFAVTVGLAVSEVLPDEG